MQINQKLSYIFISLIVVGFVIGGWYFYNQLFQGIKDPMKIVPDDAALIIEVPNFKKFTAHWEPNSSYAKAFGELPYLQDLSEWLPAAVEQVKMKSNNFESWHSPKLILSIHSKGYLVLFSAANLDLQDFAQQIFNSKAEQTVKTINGDLYIETEIQSHKVFISEKRHVFMLSNSTALIEQALKNTQSYNHFTSTRVFISLEKVSGKRSDAHIFVNYKELEVLSTAIVKDWPRPIWNHQGQIAQWSALDLSLKSNELLLNGYTVLRDTVASFLNVLCQQDAVGMSLPENFPYQTQSFQHISLNHYESFYTAWKEYLKSSGEWERNRKNFERIEKNLKKSPVEIQKAWWAGEMAQIKTESGKEYALFLAKKGRESFRVLSEVAHLSQPSVIAVGYRGLKMKEISFPYYLYTQFGPAFAKFKKTYFVVIDEIVVFAHSIKDLKAYIDLLKDGYILKKNEAYLEFSDNLSRNSNYTFYIKHPSSRTTLFEMLPDGFKSKMKSTSLMKKDLSGFSLQLNWKNEMLYTGIFVSLSGKKHKSSSQWQVNVDSDIVSGPYLVTDHTDGSHKYIVFDDFRQMYLINQRGDIVWKRQLEEAPISDVFMIDYYKNGKIQYLFNSENYLYLIDLTGRMMKGYPVSLNSEATAGLSLVDYNNNKDYRILIPTVNGEIYNYKKDGSLLKDWKATNTRRNIVKPISYVVANSKDYLIAEADNGNILMLNRKGKVRLEIRKSFTNALGSNLYPNRTNSKGMMVTTDQNGKFVYIPEKGKIKITDFVCIQVASKCNINNKRDDIPKH